MDTDVSYEIIDHRTLIQTVKLGALLNTLMRASGISLKPLLDFLGVGRRHDEKGASIVVAWEFSKTQRRLKSKVNGAADADKNLQFI